MPHYIMNFKLFIIQNKLNVHVLYNKKKFLFNLRTY